MKRIPNSLISLVILLSGIDLARSQTCGTTSFPPIDDFSQGGQTLYGDCGADTSLKYTKQAFYIPDTLDPIITVNIVFHVFRNSDGSGSYIGTDSLLKIADVLNDGFERYPQPRQANYVVSGFVSPHVGDSRMTYSVTGIYFYDTTSLFNSASPGQLLNHIYSIDSTRLTMEIPILFNKGPIPKGGLGMATTAFSHQKLYRIVQTVARHPGTGVWYAMEHLRHELSHVMGLDHLYNPGELTYGRDCTHRDFLSDCFPKNNWICPSGTFPCDCCEEKWPENTPYIYSSNNVISREYMPPNWLSPLQQGRIQRTLHLIEPVRRYAKEQFSQHFDPWIVSSNEIWDMNIQTYRDIVVEADATLIIKCRVAMAAGGRIIVKKGGKLVIDNGEITGWCKKGPEGNATNASTWDGIQVEGSNFAQTLDPMTGLCPNQGMVVVLPNSIISNAHRGIMTSLTNQAGTWISGTSGGLVQANGAIFRNNVYDIVMYQRASDNSYFTSCFFYTDGEVGRTFNNQLILPKEHIKLFKNSGITIFDCHFECNGPYTGDQRGIGVYTTDGTSVVDACTFTNLRHGFYADNFNPLYPFAVHNSTFTSCHNGLMSENVNYFSMKSNSITVPVGATWPNSNSGIYIAKSKYYSVKSNTISQTGIANTTGIYAYKSENGLHEIYRNELFNLATGISAIDHNGGTGANGLGLKLNCNVFYKGTQRNVWDIACTKSLTSMPLIMEKQSQSNPGQPEELVRNLYKAWDYGSNHQNKWYVDPSSTQSIIHSNTPTGIDNPEHPNDRASSAVNTFPTSINFNWSNDCLDFPPTKGGDVEEGDRIANLNELISDLREDMEATEYDHTADIQAAVCSKLNIFLSNVSVGIAEDYQDSIEAILTTNQGMMEDADIQLIFSYIRAAKYTQAATAIANLPAQRGDWEEVLGRYLDLELDSLGAMSLTTNYTAYESYFRELATEEGADGQALAQSISRYVFGDSVLLPYTSLPMPGDERLMSDLAETVSQSTILLYPNPSHTGFWLESRRNNDELVKLTITDALGRQISESNISLKQRKFVMLPETQGIYFVICSGPDNTIIHRQTVIKD